MVTSDGPQIVTAYIALGSNIDAERNLPAAVELLRHCPALTLKAVSPVYRTPPWGYADQADFLNAVVSVETALPPHALLDVLQEIEQKLNRKREIPNGPRTADLDLLLHGSTLLESPRLTVPHPRLHERGFVLVPLCDLAPSCQHPVLGVGMAELLNAVGAEGIRAHPLSLV